VVGQIAAYTNNANVHIRHNELDMSLWFG